MAKKTIKAQMKQRRDTKANWAATNPVLLDGELGIVSDDPNLYKVGDGATAWNSLPFRGFDGTLAQELGTSPNAAISQKVVSEKLTELESEVIDLSSIPNKNASLGSSTWFYYENLGCSHKAIKLDSYKKVSITAKQLASVGFVNNSYNPPYANNDTIPYVDGTSRIMVEANTPTTLDIPNGAAYLILTTIDGGGNTIEYSEVVLIVKSIMGQIGNLRTKVSKIEEVVGERDYDSIIDLSSIPNKNASLGSSTWFYYENLGCSHKAIKLDSYKKVSITAKQLASVGFVNNSYNPPYANNDTIPYVDGTSRIMVEANTPTTLDIPNGAAYLILTTIDGGGNTIEYSEVKFIYAADLLERTNKNTAEIERISSIDVSKNAIIAVMTYNVGSWYNGTGFPIPEEEKETYLPIQEAIMERYNPDILLIQEFSDNVVVKGLTSKQFLNSFHLVESDVNGDTWYDGKAIASKYPITNVEVVPFVTKDQHHTCFIKGNIFCNGKKVTIVSVHFVIGESSSSLQLDELLDNVKNEEYLIIGMDSNIDILTESGKKIFKKVSDAGLIYLNSDIITAPKQGLAIDNIIISPNIVAKSVLVDTRKSVLGDNADHYPLLAFLEIL